MLTRRFCILIRDIHPTGLSPLVGPVYFQFFTHGKHRCIGAFCLEVILMLKRYFHKNEGKALRSYYKYGATISGI